NGKPGWSLTILAIFFLALMNGWLAAADNVPPKAGADIDPEADKALRKQAIELNDVTGSDPAKAKILAFVTDVAATKRLLATAARMAKEKDQPFNVNATYILAETATYLKNSETAKLFYRLNIDQAVKIGSGSKITQAYGGLIALCMSDRKYA